MLANVLMALVADFMLVWLPAPTLSYRCPAPPGTATMHPCMPNCQPRSIRYCLQTNFCWAFMQPCVHLGLPWLATGMVGLQASAILGGNALENALSVCPGTQHGMHHLQA